MKRGQIYYIESNHQEIGSEQRAGRPAVIVSNDKNNENSTPVEVVYMTTQQKTSRGGVPAGRSGSYAAAADRNRGKTGSSNRRTCRTEKPAGLQALVRPADREAA